MNGFIAFRNVLCLLLMWSTTVGFLSVFSFIAILMWIDCQRWHTHTHTSSSFNHSQLYLDAALDGAVVRKRRRRSDGVIRVDDVARVRSLLLLRQSASPPLDPLKNFGEFSLIYYRHIASMIDLEPYTRYELPVMAGSPGGSGRSVWPDFRQDF